MEGAPIEIKAFLTKILHHCFLYRKYRKSTKMAKSNPTLKMLLKSKHLQCATITHISTDLYQELLDSISFLCEETNL